MSKLIDVSNYDSTVSNGDHILEWFIIGFAILIVLAILVSSTISFVQYFRAKRRTRESSNEVYEKLAEASKKENVQHECEYCGQILNDEEFCPNCGAKQDK